MQTSAHQPLTEARAIADLFGSLYVSIVSMEHERDSPTFLQELSRLRASPANYELTAAHRHVVDDSLNALEAYHFFQRNLEDQNDRKSRKAVYYDDEFKQWARTLGKLKDRLLMLHRFYAEAADKSGSSLGDSQYESS